ncbi:MAG: hypothetical protein ACD_79C00730G0002 [uncultured bacterium]|nr:MAG: hypothetical protein ACD_79C00730G0002 [uncultured bacterium]
MKKTGFRLKDIGYSLTIRISKLLLIGLFPFYLMAEEQIDEDAMFSDTETVIRSDNIVNNPDKKMEPDANSLGISGEIASVNFLALTRDYVQDGNNDENETESLIVGSLFLDGRYKNYYKLFLNWEMYNSWKDNNFESNLKEWFIDTPIENKVYLRWGKQVLQWGRCYLWNPTDLINVDKMTFIKRIGYRDGVYGLKLHVPEGTKYNFYGFLNTGKEMDKDEMSGALKTEFLMDTTEMAFSCWTKKGYSPVYGYDISSRIFKIDIAGEISVTNGDYKDSLIEENGVLYKDKINDEWITRASLNLGKGFDWNDQNEKINLTGEFFYNESGYDDNIFEDTKVYSYSEPVLNGVSSGDKKTFLLFNDLYEMNYYGKYYLAIFAAINDFFTSDYTLTLNWIENLNDNSSIASTGITYENINDWSADCIIYTFSGSENSEYTFLNESISVRLTLGYKF